MDFARDWATGWWSSSATRPSPLGGESADLRRGTRGDAVASSLTEAASSIDHEGVELEALLVDERPEEALIRIGKERSARCLVVGTRGEGPVTAAILGSVSHKLLRDRGPARARGAGWLRSRLGPCARW